MSDDYRYNIRNVSQKEIYDSYMGILRISPINIGDENENLIDDPTIFLNDLKYNKEVFLSSSNGERFCVNFVPYAFKTSNIKISPNDQGSNKDIINIATDTTSGDVMVSKSFTSRRTIRLIDDENNDPDNKLLIYTRDGILLYPSESPRDTNYFNDGNKYDLFDKNDTSTPRFNQVNSNLLKSDYYDKIYTGNNCVSDDKKVKINKKEIFQLNEDNKKVPILYTHDYVLGHTKQNNKKLDDNNIKAIIGNDDKNWYNKIYNNNQDECNVTKLSWSRIDNLIWGCLEKTLTGGIRNTKYEYIKNSSDDIYSKSKITLGGEGNIYDNTITDKLISENSAPLLGNGVQPGMIVYHAMPFHRYWFHRCRQILANDEINNKTTSEINDIKKYSSGDDNSAITKAVNNFPSSHHSLVRDYALCNGKAVKYDNFPNLNLENDKLFSKNNNGSYSDISQKTQKSSNTYDALCASSHETDSNSSNFIKLPNLFNFNEKYPRYIRGLNWSINNTKDAIVSFGKSNDTQKMEGITAENKKRISYYYKDDDDEETLKIIKSTNIWGDYSRAIVKNFTNVDKVNYFSFDHLAKRNPHYHLLFGDTLSSKTDEKPNPFFNKKDCIIAYHEAHGNADVDLIPTGRLAERIAFRRVTNAYKQYIYPLTKSLSGSSLTFTTWDNDRLHEFRNGTSNKYKKTFKKMHVGFLTSRIIGNNIHQPDDNFKSDLLYHEWLKYHFKKEEKYFVGFQPVKTCGLYMFNWHFTPFSMNQPSNVNSRGIYIPWKDIFNSVTNDISSYNDGTDNNNECVSYENFYNYINTNKDAFGYYDANGDWHSLIHGMIPIDKKSAEPSELQKYYTLDDIKEYRRHRYRLRQLVTKMNESEGIYPISKAGFASFTIKTNHRWKRKGSHTDTEVGDMLKFDVASYQFRSPASFTVTDDIKEYEINTQNVNSNISEDSNESTSTNDSEENDTDENDTINYDWRTMTSLQYYNCDKLGCGDLSKLDESLYIDRNNLPKSDENYNVTNNVTDIWKKTNQSFTEILNYGNQRIEVDTKSPYPSTLNLLPLIRI